MTAELRTTYAEGLNAAAACIKEGDFHEAMYALRSAMQAANKSKDARYRRAVFRAMSYTRVLKAG